jgi:ABC-type dipeptide/oligopeptide/nickel transport system ATPase component
MENFFRLQPRVKMAIGVTVSSLSKPIPGCAFAERCEFAAEACRAGGPPALAECAPGHAHACRRAHAGEI